MTEFIKRNTDLIGLVLLWVLTSAFLGHTAAIVVSVVSYAVFVSRMEYGKILLAFLTMLIFSDSRSSLFAFAAQAKVFLVVITAALVLLKWNELEGWKNKFFTYFSPFFFYIIISVPFAFDMFDGFQKTLSYTLIYLIIPILFLNALKEKKQFSLDMVWYFFFILSIGLALYFINYDFVTLKDRYRGLLGNPNGLGILITLATPIFFLGFREKFIQGPKNFKVLVYGAALLSVLLCGSRTTILAIGMFLLFSSVPSLRGGLGIFIFLLIVLSYEFVIQQLPVILIALDLQDYFRIETLLEGSGRLVAWQFAWREIQDVFFFGGGFDYTNNVFYGENQSYLSLMGHQGNAHNSYLTLWLDTGLVGMLLFVFGFIRSIGFCLRGSYYTLPVVYMVLFSANFESWLSASLNPFTSMFLMVLSMLAYPEIVGEEGQASVERTATKNNVEKPIETI